MPQPQASNNGCNDIQIFRNGVCEICPLYTRAMDGNTRCAADTCAEGQDVDTAGHCTGFADAGYVPPAGQCLYN